MNGKMFQDGLCCIGFDKTAAKTKKKSFSRLLSMYVDAQYLVPRPR